MTSRFGRALLKNFLVTSSAILRRDRVGICQNCRFANDQHFPGTRLISRSSVVYDKKEDGTDSAGVPTKVEDPDADTDAAKGQGQSHPEEEEEYVEVQPPPFPHPIKRTINILKHDVKSLVDFDDTQPPLLEFSSSADIVIIGGGIVGTAIAYYMKNRLPREALRIAVIEKDLGYTRSSTVLSVGGLSHQFSLRENILMSLFSAEWLRNIKTHLYVEGASPPEIQFHPQGYLMLADSKGAGQLEENFHLQRDLGAHVELFSPNMLKDMFPWMNVDGVEVACRGLESEGWFDPWALLFALKRKAISLGVEYINAEVVGFEFRTEETTTISGVEKQHPEFLDKALVKTSSGEIKSIKFAHCIVAAGHESGSIAEMARIGRGPGILSVPLPIEPRKRYVYCFHAPSGPGVDCPLVIDSSGAYFRREGLAGHFVCGQSPPLDDEPNTETLDVDYSYFENVVWPNLVKRVPAFANLKVKSAWAGFYDYNSFDQTPVIGPHPYHVNLLFACGFGGHGIQQAPAVARGINELILDGEFRAIDLSRFLFERLMVGMEVKETNIV